MKLSLLTVNYNTEKYLEALLKSLKQQTMSFDDFEVIISNNVQNDKLDQMIKENDFEVLNIKVVNMESNVGFGKATNAAAKEAKGEHLLIINPDILMTDDNYLLSMYEFILETPDYGIISSKILNDEGRDGCDHYSYEFSEKFGFENEICWIEGSLMFIRKDTFNLVGGFDDDFFMYSEDVDLSYRIKKQGLPLIKNEKLSVYHKCGASEPNKDYAFYHRWYKSRILFMHKHYSEQQFNSFLKGLDRKLKLKKIRYNALSVFSDNYKHKVLRTQVMQDIIKKTMTDSASWLYQ